MKSLRWGLVMGALVVLTGALNTACSTHYVVVPQPEDGYRATDTLWGRLDGDEVRVTFWFDTIMRVDTVVRVDTLWRAGTRTIVRVDTVVRTDTVRVPVRTRTRISRGDTIRIAATDTVVRVDTVRVPVTNTVIRVDTVLRVDTVRVSTTETVVDTIVRVDTVRVSTRETVVDTLVRVDTVRISSADTVRVPGQRVLFVPPGHYPPDGQCRVWIHDLPPGRQADPAPCDALGQIPDGAFILFGGDAWDFDYDWIAVSQRDPDAVPPEIVALKRKG